MHSAPLFAKEALTRAVGSKYYNLSAHLVWIGDRTRQLDCAHIEYFRGISNPIGVKVGPSMKNDELKDLVTVLNPKKEEGRLMLITRYGAGKAEAMLPGHIQAAGASLKSSRPLRCNSRDVGEGGSDFLSHWTWPGRFGWLPAQQGPEQIHPESVGETAEQHAEDKASEKVATVQTLKQVEETMKSNDGKAVFCRCWRSSKFPYCDGSHGKYNKECCDNTGPLVLKTA
eukprot:g31344.t1